MLARKTAIQEKVWSIANALRDEGVGKSDYIEQITFLLFLKLADEYSKTPYDRDIGVPEYCSWETLKYKSGADLIDNYEFILEKLSNETGLLKEIFAGAQNKINTPVQLSKIISVIDGEKWSSMSSDVKGDIYEYMLEKTAGDVKSGAGQYFTPRPLINAIIKCVRPSPLKTVADPACGTAGFLLGAHSFIENNYDLNVNERTFLKYNTFRGWEIVPNASRMGLMNLLLHNISDFEKSSPIIRADALLSDPGERFDYVLTNPPFGNKSSMTITNDKGVLEGKNIIYQRQDFWTTTNNKQLNFIQHIHTILKTGGTAAVIVPDNILFESGPGEIVRRNLLQSTNLHTILRLPKHLFYATTVNANVIFFENRPASPFPQTNIIWIYDYRSDVKITLKQNPFLESNLDEFVTLYNPSNINNRVPTYSNDNPNGRWRSFTYEEIISRRNIDLDIFWIKDNNNNDDDMNIHKDIEEYKENIKKLFNLIELLEDAMRHIK
ncbi:MAG: type I restriction-modification system subunit M [Deltaproteobacteria bacterium]|nr:type I restriction-modification system subunit M [Deltaproteobacteria bacterium]